MKNKEIDITNDIQNLYIPDCRIVSRDGDSSGYDVYLQQTNKRIFFFKLSYNFGELHLGNLFSTAEKFKNQGFGSAIMKKVVAIADKYNIEKIFVHPASFDGRQEWLENWYRSFSPKIIII